MLDDGELYVDEPAPCRGHRRLPRRRGGDRGVRAAVHRPRLPLRRGRQPSRRAGRDRRGGPRAAQRHPVDRARSSAPTRWSTSCRPTSSGASGATSSRCPPTARSATSGSAGSADAQIFAPTASRNADVSAFFARWLRDVVDGQDADGAFRDVAPVARAGPRGRAGLGRRRGDHPLAPVAHLRRPPRARALLRRDGRLGRAHPPAQPGPAVAAPHRQLLRRLAPGRRRHARATCCRPRTSPAARSSSRDAARGARPRRRRGASTDALHAAIRTAFVESYVGRRRHASRAAPRPPTCWRWRSGCCRRRWCRRRSTHLAADIEKRDNRLTTGFVGVALLCPVLADHGRADLAYALLHQEEFPSWGYSIRHGATTIWERWDGWTEHGGFQSAAMNSFNHYSLGSVGDWLFGRVAGIDQTPGSVAYRELLLRPLPGGRLTWARAEQETARGRVACGWSRRRRPDHRDRHRAARQHRRAGDPHGRPGQRAEGDASAATGRACSSPAVSRRSDPAAGLRPLHLQRASPPTFTSQPGDIMKNRSAGPAGRDDRRHAAGRLQRRHQRRVRQRRRTPSPLASVDQGSVEDVVKAFEAANPGVKVNFTTSGADQYQQQIRTQLSSGTAPDVMSVWPGNGNPGRHLRPGQAGLPARPVRPAVGARSYPDAVKSVAQYEGKTYNAIFGLNGIGAVYNQRGHDQGRAHRAEHLDRAAGVLPGRRRPRAPRRSRWASRTTG